MTDTAHPRQPRVRPAVAPGGAIRYLRVTAVVIACAFSVAAAGCRGSSKTSAPPVTAAPQATTTLIPSTATPQTTTTTPLPDTSGTDFTAVVRGLDLLQNLASERVDLGLLDVIYTPDAEERKTVEKQLRYLLENGWHYDDKERSTVADVTATTPVDGVAVVDFTSSQGTQVLKDTQGQVVKTGDGWPPRRQRYGLFRGADGRWRIRDSSVTGPA